MKSLLIFYAFYQRLIPSAIFFSLAVGLFKYILPFPELQEKSFTNIVGTAFIIALPFFHLVIYELRDNNEYHFYYNLGFGKMLLWIISMALAFFFGVSVILFL